MNEYMESIRYKALKENDVRRSSESEENSEDSTSESMPVTDAPYQHTSENGNFENDPNEIVAVPVGRETRVQRSSVTNRPEESMAESLQKSSSSKPVTINKRNGCMTISKKVVRMLLAAVLLCAVLVVWIPGDSSIQKRQSSRQVASSELLLLRNDREIWSIDPKNLTHDGKLTPIKEEFDADSIKFILHWLERNAMTVGLLLGHDLTNLSYPRQWNPRGIALDFVTEKLYVVDELAEALYVLDMKRQHHGVLLSDLRQPIDLVLDPLEGVAFIVQKDHSILRINMDGTSAIEILRNNGISAIAIDRKDKKLYWVLDNTIIESANYDGGNRLKIFNLAYPGIVSVAVFDDRLFWLYSDLEQRPFSNIIHCLVNGSSCEDFTFHTLSLYLTKIEAPLEKTVIPFENPCAQDNGGCKHMCLLTAKAIHNCACRLGWQLQGDGKTCEVVNKYLLYTQGNYFKGRILDPMKQTFTDVITPTWFEAGSIKIRWQKKDTIYFDKSWNNNEVFFSDDHHIHRLSLEDGQQSGVLEIKAGYYIKGLAVDRMSRNVYYLRVSESGKSQTLKAITITQSEVFTKTITMVTSKNIFVGLSSDSLMVHPRRSQLFYKVHTTRVELISVYPGRSKPEIYAVLADSMHDSCIAIDAKDNRTYWIDEIQRPDRIKIKYVSWYSGNIEFLNLDGFQMRYQRELVFRYSLHVHDEQLYITDFHNVWSINKRDGMNLTLMYPRFQREVHGVAGVKIVLLSEKEAISSDCLKDNGDCEHFCFMAEAKVCSCSDTYTIESDGHCRYNTYHDIRANGRNSTSDAVASGNTIIPTLCTALFWLLSGYLIMP